MSLNQNIIHSKNDSRKLNQFKTICNKFDQQEKKISKSTQKNRKLRKENNLLNKMIKQFDDNLGIEKTKRNALEQYGRQDLLEITGIPQENGENCIEINFKICE